MEMTSLIQHRIGEPLSPQGLFDVRHNICFCIPSPSDNYVEHGDSLIFCFGCRIELKSPEECGGITEKSIVDRDDGRNE